MIYTFWENKMPSYIALCMETWDFPYVVLNYSSLNQYTDLPLERLKQFTILQQSDVIRVHILRDNGGYWLDGDTIINGELPTAMFVGDNDKRINSIGYLYAEKPKMPIFKAWAKYQDKILKGDETSKWWALMANDFTDPYLKKHTEIEIGNIYKHWLETDNEHNRQEKYVDYYFKHSHTPTLPNMVMLHNSWTPKWYKNLPRDEVLAMNCTLSNILKTKVKQ